MARSLPDEPIIILPPPPFFGMRGDGSMDTRLRNALHDMRREAL
jgi:hypothetical protein